eukprot:scaffold22126_cov59-Attheya_sp.AAC.2
MHANRIASHTPPKGTARLDASSAHLSRSRHIRTTCPGRNRKLVSRWSEGLALGIPRPCRATAGMSKGSVSV